MGLVVEVGFLIDVLQEDPEAADEFREQLAAVNRVLVANGLPEHHEPEDAEWEVLSYDMFGYSGLHYLRRVAAHLATRGSLPLPGDDRAAEDPVLRGYHGRSESKLRRLFKLRAPDFGTARKFSHLIDHSDAEGFYVPIHFDAVLASTRDTPPAGALLGSSHALVKELEELAAALALPPDLDPESEALWDAADEQGTGDTTWKRYGVVSFTCARLLAAARASIERGAAIVFC